MTWLVEDSQALLVSSLPIIRLTIKTLDLEEKVVVYRRFPIEENL